MKGALAVAALILAAAPARAELLTSGTCQAGWDQLSTGALSGMGAFRAASKVRMTDGWCRLIDVEITPEGQYQPGYRIGALSWKADGLQAFLDAGTPPRSLDLQIKDARIAIQTGDPVTDYLFRAQNNRNGIDGALAIAWSAADKRLTLTRLEIDFPGANAIRATVVADRVDLTSRASAQTSLGAMRLTDLTLDVTTNGLFESYVLMPVGMTLLSGVADPEVELTAAVTAGKAMIATLPEATFPAATRTALVAVLDEMPNPAGTLNLTVQAADGVGAARFARLAMTGVPRSAADMAPLFDGVKVSAVWTPTPEGAE
jgi:hypothetical protein